MNGRVHALAAVEKIALSGVLTGGNAVFVGNAAGLVISFNC